jgi:hypothetical protein
MLYRIAQIARFAAYRVASWQDRVISTTLQSRLHVQRLRWAKASAEPLQMR